MASAGVANFESALRQNLTMALSSAELDDQMINGARCRQRPRSGCLRRSTNPTADGTTLTFAHGSGRSSPVSIDGLWAVDTMQVRQIVGVDTYRLAASQTSPAAPPTRASVTLGVLAEERVLGGLSAPTPGCPRPPSMKQQGLAFRSGVSGVRTAVCPTLGQNRQSPMSTAGSASRSDGGEFSYFGW